MNFEYSDEQRMLADSANRLGADLWPSSDRLKLLEHFDTLTAHTSAQMAELGWLMLPIAEEDGGLGGSAVDVMAIMEGIGRHLIPTSYVANAVLVPALVSGDPAAADLLGAIGEGSAKAAAGLLEPDGGFDLGWVECAAAGSSGGNGTDWTLTGEKLHVEDGADADWFVVTARTDAGISLFLVRADAPGLAVSRFRAIDQHRHARLKLDGVTAVLMGEAGAALPTVELAVDKAICAHLAEAVGSMEAAHAATLEYLRTRKQFGVAIGSFQSLQHRAVDMAIALEEARSMAYRATLSLGLPAVERRRVVSAAKARVGQCGLYVGRQAVQLHGGVGFSDELIISHHLKRQMMLDCAYGSAEHHVAGFVALQGVAGA
ncbi:acyl-CoA dehydrogenase family protein [Novosphingobium guangzhouense]|uniref:Acyl-CoA dehydrogenase n=1 Tax=Novosphingobium guangzhouense TaxID=1850347 RepID=A0A2K2FU09_9SPHN|nr:acyl-CoA dehydrogenase family protein [Novosphingobium guangzhouense]PNU02262.1 acyl-CoA dehydrogenase [Novosphingobium guangzhouense]